MSSHTTSSEHAFFYCIINVSKKSIPVKKNSLFHAGHAIIKIKLNIITGYDFMPYGFLVDSHCHLNDQRYEGRYTDVIQRAKNVGVKSMITISTTPVEWDDLVRISNSDPDVFCSVGTHPCYFDDPQNIYSLDLLLQRAAFEKCVGIGETGLDYYHSLDHVDAQKKSLINHIQASRETGLPLIIHTRNADQDTADILVSEYKNTPFTGLIHCFSSDVDFAKRMLDIDFYISMSGVLTYKKATNVQDAARYIPLDRLLVETDAPYLTPQAVRREPINEPAFTTYTAQYLADLKQMPLDDIMHATSENFFRIFTKATPPKNIKI
jgi:TatD DNase family protein